MPARRTSLWTVRLPELPGPCRDDGSVESDQDGPGRSRPLERLQPQDLRGASAGTEVLGTGHPTEKPPGEIRRIDAVAGLVHEHSLLARRGAGNVPVAGWRGAGLGDHAVRKARETGPLSDWRPPLPGVMSRDSRYQMSIFTLYPSETSRISGMPKPGRAGSAEARDGSSAFARVRARSKLSEPAERARAMHKLRADE